MLHHLGPALLGLVLPLALLASPRQAHARRDDASCDAIKPVQSLTVEQQEQVDRALSLGFKAGYSGDAKASAESTKTSTSEVRFLAEDTLAKGWFIYQACVLRESGAISDQLHEDMMRKLFDLEPVQDRPDPPAEAPAPGKRPRPRGACPWDEGITSATVTTSAIVLNGDQLAIKGRKNRQHVVTVLQSCGAGGAAVRFEQWRRSIRRRNVLIATVFGVVVAPIPAVYAGVHRVTMTADLKRTIREAKATDRQVLESPASPAPDAG